VVYFLKKENTLTFLVGVVDGEGVGCFSFPSVDVFVGESTTKLAPWSRVPLYPTILKCIILMGNAM